MVQAYLDCVKTLILKVFFGQTGMCPITFVGWASVPVYLKFLHSFSMSDVKIKIINKK